MATAAQIADLRDLTDEPTTANFTDAELGAFIDAVAGDVDFAAVAVWERKSASYSSLVDTSESGSSRKNSDLYRNAIAMAKYFREKNGDADVTPSVVRTRVRRIVRR